VKKPILPSRREPVPAPRNFSKILPRAVDKGPDVDYIMINPVFWRWMANAIGPERAFFFD
jgi:hypothetical protein